MASLLAPAEIPAFVNGLAVPDFWTAAEFPSVNMAGVYAAVAAEAARRGWAAGDENFLLFVRSQLASTRAAWEASSLFPFWEATGVVQVSPRAALALLGGDPDFAGRLIWAGQNVTAFTRSGAGVYLVTIDPAALGGLGGGTVYDQGRLVGSVTVAGGTPIVASVVGNGDTQVAIYLFDGAGAPIDSAFNCIFFFMPNVAPAT